LSASNIAFIPEFALHTQIAKLIRNVIPSFVHDTWQLGATDPERVKQQNGSISFEKRRRWDSSARTYNSSPWSTYKVHRQINVPPLREAE
jgi:hypothetical protein